MQLEVHRRVHDILFGLVLAAPDYTGRLPIRRTVIYCIQGGPACSDVDEPRIANPSVTH